MVSTDVASSAAAVNPDNCRIHWKDNALSDWYTGQWLVWAHYSIIKAEAIVYVDESIYDEVHRRWDVAFGKVKGKGKG